MKYGEARALTWKILVKHQIKSLPIDVMEICKAEKISLFTYEQGRNFIKSLNLEEQIIENDAFSVGNIIFYDEKKPRQRQRFSIAHEIGHIFLHLDNGNKATVYNRDPSTNDNPTEAEANAFAARLLAPLCVIQFLNLNSAKEIADFCDISYTAAKARFNRLCEVRKLNSKRRKDNKHGTFLLSKYEREVVKQFEEYINENKKIRSQV